MPFSLSFPFPQSVWCLETWKSWRTLFFFRTLKGSLLLLLISGNTCALLSLIGLQLVPLMWERAGLCSLPGNLDIVCHCLFPKLYLYLHKLEGVLIFRGLHSLSTDITDVGRSMLRRVSVLHTSAEQVCWTPTEFNCCLEKLGGFLTNLKILRRVLYRRERSYAFSGFKSVIESKLPISCPKEILEDW